MTKKLLLADDSITIQKVIGIIFETEDYQLLVTDNGDDALTQTLAERPDLVIADITMPGKDGFELCQAIKSNPRLSDTTVLLLPGTFDHFDEQRALAVGADGWLKKPFESQALLDKVAQLLAAEPTRLPGESSASVASAVPALEESPADSAFAAVDDGDGDSFSAPDVDEVVLGLDELDVPEVNEELAETSADDIWDSVSFADDDLSPPIETADAADFSFADTADEETLTEAEPALAGSLEPLAEETEVQDEAELYVLADADNFASGTETGYEVSTAAVPDFALTGEDAAWEAVATAEPADVGESESLVLPPESDDEPLELLAEDMEPAVFAATSGVDSEELEPLNLAEETADVEEFIAAEAGQPQPTVAVTEDFSSVGSFPREEEDEVLELVDEDIYDEAPRADELVAEDSELIELADDEIVAEENFSFADAGSFIPPATAPPVDLATPVTGTAEGFEAPLTLEDAAIELEEEQSLPSAEAADEDFAFGDSAAEGPVAAEFDEAEEPAGAIAAPAVATAALVPSVAVEQVEQQLRQLSDQDLQDVVARVAGPIIERLAKELLEQIAWEVVPDLAEAMIREEIRKIKHPAA